MREPTVTTWARAMAGIVARAGPRKRAAIAFLSGALSVLALAPFFFSPVLFLTVPLLVWLIDTAERAPLDQTLPRPIRFRDRLDSDALGRAGIAGWFFGLGYFIFGLFWIGEAFLVEADKFAWLLPAAVTLLPAGLAMFFAAAAIIARAIWRPGFARIIILATLIGSAEWLRGHIFTGLPWNTLGYALTSPLLLMQSAGLIGIYGLTVVTVIVAAAPLVVAARLSSANEADAARTHSTAHAWWSSPYAGAAVAALLLAVLAAYGAIRLRGDAGASVPGVKLRIVQPSVPQRDKWLPAKQREIFDLHLDLSQRNPDGEPDKLASITHVIWPEAAMPFLPLNEPVALAAIGDMLPNNVHLITGALRVERPPETSADASIPRTTNEKKLPASNDARASATTAQKQRTRAYNSLMAFGSEGGLVTVYDKIHLVPFGEYLPFQDALESIGLEQLTRIRGGFTAGRSPRPLLDVPGLPPLIALVCYEAIFPAAVVQGADRPSLVLNVTNDGWFGNTTGPRQHLHMARVRAVEEGVPLIRAANNGISAIIDSYGRVLNSLKLDQRGVLDADLPASATKPAYACWGDRLFVIYIFLSMAWFAGSSLTSRFHG